MRAYISIDMEGVAGVGHEDQTDPIEPRHAGEYNRFRRLMTNEANAAIAGGLEAGATGIVVNDSHWLMRNLGARSLTRWPVPAMPRSIILTPAECTRRGGFRDESDGGHGGTGSGIEPDGRTDGKLYG
jgi:D-aminopeptidase